MNEIIGTVANERTSLGLYPQRWWSKKSKINKRKMVSEEIHLEGVKRKETGRMDKWESSKDTAVLSNLKHL